jgi:hypothetical protein
MPMGHAKLEFATQGWWCFFWGVNQTIFQHFNEKLKGMVKKDNKKIANANLDFQ